MEHSGRVLSWEGVKKAAVERGGEEREREGVAVERQGEKERERERVVLHQIATQTSCSGSARYRRRSEPETYRKHMLGTIRIL